MNFKHLIPCTFGLTTLYLTTACSSSIDGPALIEKASIQSCNCIENAVSGTLRKHVQQFQVQTQIEVSVMAMIHQAYKAKFLCKFLRLISDILHKKWR